LKFSNSKYYINGKICTNICLVLTPAIMELSRTVEAVDPEQHILSITGNNRLHTPA
jgi:hypothetical protein